MSKQRIGVAVVGAGMAGRAHLAGYRVAPTIFEPGLPPVDYVAVADVAEPVAKDAVARWGYERHTTDWHDVIEDDDVDVISVAVANHLHREIVEVALAAGKHVLCEKPLAPRRSTPAASSARRTCRSLTSGRAKEPVRSTSRRSRAPA